MTGAFTVVEPVMGTVASITVIGEAHRPGGAGDRRVRGAPAR